MIQSLRDLLTSAIQNECTFYFSPLGHKNRNVFLGEQAKEIVSAHNYLLNSQGKLIRPLLLLLTAGSLGGERALSVATPSALAIELVHTYSLIHDDLPCMDNDALRRGKPTTHMVFGEAKALLVGDGLLTAAFEILTKEQTFLDTKISKVHSTLILRLVQTLTQASGPRGMIWGQWLDIAKSQIDTSISSHTENSDWEIFKNIHVNKTGKLFGACFAMGFLCGVWTLQHRYSEEQIQKMHHKFVQIGCDIGLSFQIMDDILDSTQNSEQLGKTAGKDAEQNKHTAVKILGLEAATQMANQYLNNAIQNLEKCMDDFESADMGVHAYRHDLFNTLKNLSQRTT